MRQLEYLMLDKQDITKICGKIKTTQLLKETGFDLKTLRKNIDKSFYFRDKYILVENR